jgi:glycosyltransferase involved in cell wall biosynthesis/predicted nicotinamide N-methyase
MKLSVVIPFYNEARTLPKVIERLLAVDFASLGLDLELIFVDDGSTDRARELLDPPPRDDIRLIVHSGNRGKGAAVKTGLEAATGDVLCIQDADLEYHPNDLLSLVQPILDGEYEVVYGSRFKGSAAGLYYTHRLANRLLNLTVNVLFNRYLSDVYTGYKVFTRNSVKGLRLTAQTFTVELELTAHFLRKGLVIYEMPISYQARTYDQGKKIRFKDGFLAAGAALRYRIRPMPRATGPLSRRAPDRPGPLGELEGAGGSIHTLGLEDLSEAVRYRRYLYELIEPHLGNSVLEVGAGLGDFAAQLHGRKRVVVTDNDQFCLRVLEKRFASQPEVEVQPLDLSGATWYDPPVASVLAINVLEHLEDDTKALMVMAAAAAPGGNVVVFVPGYPSLYGAFDRAVGHLRRYTPAMLRDAVEAAGLEATVLRPVNLLGGLAWWASVRVGGQARPTPGLVKLYDRLVVPIVRASEQRFQPPFGQSLLCVARVPLKCGRSTPPRGPKSD